MQGVTARLQGGCARRADERCAFTDVQSRKTACAPVDKKRSWLRIPLPQGIVDPRRDLRQRPTTLWHGTTNLAHLEISRFCWKFRGEGSVVGEWQTMVDNGLLMSLKEERFVEKR